MSNEKKMKTNESITLPIEVINAFPYLSKISIILLIDLYKLFEKNPNLVFSNYDFKYYFNYSRGSYSKFISECEKQDLIKVFKNDDFFIILINNENGRTHYNFLNENKNKGRKLHELFTISHGIPPVINNPRINKNAGSVYILKYGSQYKIGCSNNIDKRLHDLNKNTPHEITLIHSIETNNKYTLEKELHHKYKDKRVKGEWFDLLDSDIEDIKNIVEVI